MWDLVWLLLLHHFHNLQRGRVVESRLGLTFEELLGHPEQKTLVPTDCGLQRKWFAHQTTIQTRLYGVEEKGTSSQSGDEDAILRARGCFARP